MAFPTAAIVARGIVMARAVSTQAGRRLLHTASDTWVEGGTARSQVVPTFAVPPPPDACLGRGVRARGAPTGQSGSQTGHQVGLPSGPHAGVIPEGESE